MQSWGWVRHPQLVHTEDDHPVRARAATGDAVASNVLHQLPRQTTVALRRGAAAVHQSTVRRLGPRRPALVFGEPGALSQSDLGIAIYEAFDGWLAECWAGAWAEPPAALRARLLAAPSPACVAPASVANRDARAVLDAIQEARALWLVPAPGAAAPVGTVHQLPSGPPQCPELAAALALPELSPGEQRALDWAARHRLFFDLGLDREPRVRLHRTEGWGPDQSPLAAALQHLGIAGSPPPAAPAPSVELPPLRPAVRAVVEALAARLAAHQSQPLPLPRRIMLLIDTLGRGGAERYVVTVANRWAEQGIAVTVVSGGGELQEELDPRVRAIVGPFDEVRASLPAVAPLLRRHIKQARPEAIVTNSLATAILARAAQPLGRIPVINVGHGWPPARYARVARPMAIAERVVAVSPDVKRRLVEAGLDEARAVVVHNGVDLRPFGPVPAAERDRVRRELGAGPDELLVVTVGRLEDQKAHQHIFAIAAQLRERLPGLRFALVGSGSRAAELAALRQRLGLEQTVALPGKRTDIPAVLAAADVFLNCSDWEGMPLSTIEAMGAKLPVVATDTEGAAQLFTPETGVVVPVGSVDDMSRAIAALAEDPTRRADMGAAARQRAHAHFSHERMVDQLMEVVQSVARPEEG